MYTLWHEKLLLYRLHHERDPDAFGELYDRYAPKIYRYIYFKVSGRTEVEDLTAEVFLKTWEYVQRHAEDETKRIKNFRAFVYRLARNLVVDHYRERTERELLADEATLERVPVPDEQHMLTAISRSSDLAMVERALRNLKDEYRELVVLRYIEGLSTVDIARITDKTKGTVRVTLHRALIALKEEVEKMDSQVKS